MTVRWFKIYRCKGCNHKLSEREYGYSRGCCPYCGRMSDSTFCDVYEIAVKQTRLNPAPWWKFWVKPQYRYEERKD